MRTIDQWLSLYGESHQNPTNKQIHRVCVPLIMLSLLGMLALVPMPEVLMKNRIDLSMIVIILSLIFYLILSRTFFILMIGVVTPMLLIIDQVGRNFDTQSALIMWAVIFVVAWIGQFVGHKIEGKKPSFLEDLAFLLIGPLWIMAPIFPKYRS